MESWLTIAILALLASTAGLLAARRRASGSVARAVAAIATVLAGIGLAVAGFGGAALVPVLIGVVAALSPRHWHVAGTLFFASLLVAFGTFAAYLVRATFLLGGEPIGIALGTVLLLFELAAMGLLIGAVFEMVDALAAHPPERPAVSEPASWPVVCLQVPTYNEPPDLVIETIRSLVAIDYPALRVQVIDNNTTEDELWKPVEAECRRLRSEGHSVHFVHLATWPGYKAGALNWGLRHLTDDVEVLGVVDADYVADAGWLRATIPYFNDPQVAFVQTPQDYRAWEHSAFYRSCYTGFALFFKIGMVSRSRRNSFIFAGTMGLVRRSALDGAGGWDEAIITEDAELSLRLFAEGWSAVYVPTAYGRGIMPLTYEGLRKQRFRWAFGGIQILRRHWRLLMPWNRRSGLTPAQRWDHLMSALWWFNDALTFAFSLFVFATAIAAILDRPFVVQRLSGVGLVLPLFFIGINLTRYVWATHATMRAGVGAALMALQVNVSLSWVVALACLRALSQERGVFLRTPKFQGAAAARELRLVWVETAIAVAALLLVVGVLFRGAGSLVSMALVGLLAWSLVIYGSATLNALGDPTRRPLTAALREKALLELRPRLGRVARARSTRLAVASSLAAAALLLAVAAEGERAPIAELPFSEPMPIGGPGDVAEGLPLRGAVPSDDDRISPTPTASESPAGENQDDTGATGADSGPAGDSAGGTPTPQPAQPAPAPTPAAPDATPVPEPPTTAPAPTAPVAVPTPEPAGPSDRPSPPDSTPTPPPVGPP